MPHHAATALCQEYCDLFSNLTPENLDQFLTCVSSDIRFKDPFNDVVGFEKNAADLIRDVRAYPKPFFFSL